MRGVCTHLTGLSAAALSAELEAIKAAGFTHIRQDLFWNMTNPKPGRYEFGTFDRIAAECERLGLGVLWVLCYGNNYLYAAPDDKIPPDPSDHQWWQWLEAVAVRYGMDAWGFEIYNEANRAEFFKPKPNVEHYLRMCEVAWLAMSWLYDRGDNYTAFIIGAVANKKGSDELDWDFLESLKDWKGAFISVHPYTQGDIQKRRKDMDRLNFMLNPNDAPSRVIWTEMGNSKAWPGDQKARNDEAFALADELGIPMFLYCWNNRKAIGAVERGYAIS